MAIRFTVLFICAAFLMGQQTVPPEELRLSATAYVPPSLFSVKTETRLVDVGVVVRDARNHTVGGLTREDFEIDEGGKKRPLSAFTAEVSTPPAPPAPAPVPGSPATTAAPAPAASAKPPVRYLALVFDDLSMTAGDLMPARIAAKKFVAKGISPGDQVGLFFMSKGQILPFTSDTAKLNEGLDHLNIATRTPLTPTCPNLTTYEAYLIANRIDPTLLPIKVAEAMQCGYCRSRDSSCTSRVEEECRRVWEEVRFVSANALYSIRGIVDFMAKLPGKRVLLMTSSGFLSGTLEDQREDVVNRALRGEVVINSLDAKGLYTQDMGIASPGMNVRSMIARQSQGTRPQQESNDTMAILAASTGGLFFHNNNDLELGFHELGLLPEFSYSLAFTPPGAPDGKYHSLKVRLKNHHYDVESRSGYFAAIVAPEQPRPERRIDKEVMTAQDLDEVPVKISADPVKTAEGPGLRVVMHLDIGHLPLTNQFDVRTDQLIVIAALFDTASSFVAGKECRLEFNLKEKSYQLLAHGMDAGLTVIAPVGKYRLRAVVRDGNENKFSASSQQVEIQ
ncbi:MAG TPA: VWA domain-containing protein [Candidatus Sulfopaludibacter sp.]|nr:VWA domain-containing protein [Candidatus Sulfopaludibacter sp.]